MMCQPVARLFLSTLSLRRATNNVSTIRITRKNFYPRSPCGERRALFLFPDVDIIFLSTLSLRRATSERCRMLDLFIVFLSTLSLRRATCEIVSIERCSLNFYPRSPCGERRAETAKTSNADIFLSTLSLRRATLWGWAD